MWGSLNANDSQTHVHMNFFDILYGTSSDLNAGNALDFEASRKKKKHRIHTFASKACERSTICSKLVNKAEVIAAICEKNLHY